MQPRPATSVTGRLVLLVVAVTGFSLLTTLPAGSSVRARAVKVVARVGHLQILNPFLPNPASPSVASIYLTIKNTGSTPDVLVSVRSPISPDAMLMTENGPGSAMAMIDALRIPAHGTATLAPGHLHVMLVQPRARVAVGETVPVTLQFKKAGSVTFKVPVVPLSRILTK